MKAIRNVTIVVLAALILPAGLFAEDLAAVEAQIKEKSAKLTGFRAKQRMTMEISNPIMTMNNRGEGTIEFRRDGSTILSRNEMTTKSSRTVGDKVNEVEQKRLIVIDGKNMYTLTDSQGTKRAIKSEIDLVFTPLPEPYLASLKKANTLKLIGEESVGGRNAWVIEAKPSNPPPAGATTPVATKAYFDKDTGVVLKTESLTAEGKPLQVTEYIDHQFDVKIEAERFKFTLPDGVELINQADRKLSPGPIMPATQPAATKPAKP